MLAAQSAPMSGAVVTVVVLVTSIALVAGLAWASRRLLGLPVGTMRALIAGLLGFAAAEAFGRALQPVPSSRGVAAFFTVAVGGPLIAAMIFIVVAEALVPTGTGPRPVEVALGLQRALARSLRYSQISRIAVRHELGPYLRGRRLRRADAAGGRAALAVSLRRALEEGGVTFTKLGQPLSTRRDLLPPEFIAELARLQDRAEPAPWAQVEAVISQSLRVPPGQVFAELNPEPAAAASIAQVHRARLRCAADPGGEVAVKVQRPGIRATVERDLDIVLRMAARLEDRTRWARAVGAVGLARGFAAAIREELDFRVEARNIAAIAATWTGQQRAASGSVPVMLPAVHEDLCSEQVFVTEWLDGVNLGAAGQLIDDQRLERAELARALLRSLLYQITESGVFHADPHPGKHPAAHRRPPRPARPRLGRPARRSAAVRPAEPAVRRRARRPRGALRRPAGTGHPPRRHRRTATGAGAGPVHGAAPGGRRRTDRRHVRRPVPAGLPLRARDPARDRRRVP